MQWRRGLWIWTLVLLAALLILWALPAKAGDTQAGKAIYKKRCVICHGETGAGDGPMGKLLKPPPPSLADANRMAGRSDEDLIKIISDGQGRMPSYKGQLSQGQIEDVLAYIRTLASR
jgi:mono/diheme cytochrome c family protein